eukprot:gene9442-11589_t
MTKFSSPSASPDQRSQEATNPHSPVVEFGADKPLHLDSGVVLSPFRIAYQSYGTLNADKSNAILICHALTGDQHVANVHPVTGKNGWWETLVGPGKPIDTDRFFVLCSNVLGGCLGSTGPASINPETGKPYALDLSIITIADMVRAQAMLVDHFGIKQLFAVVGGSMGGMQVLEWASSHSDRVFAAVAIATGARHSSQNIAFHEVGRQAVMADPEWREGRYLEEGTIPRKGLSVARMAAHITYLSETALHRKFGRNLQDRQNVTFGFDADFQIESYLRHQGMSFVERFDPNSYLYMTRAMDYFDLAAEHEGRLADAFAGSKTRFCIVSFTSDWLFPTSESRTVAHALNAAGASVSFVEIETDRGHDAFLLDEPEMFSAINGFIRSAAPMSVNTTSRVDFDVIASLVNPGARVLDVGCGDGELLELLQNTKNVDGRGVELSQKGVNESVARGLSVIQGDADSDLKYYPDAGFDYVILSQTLQATRNPKNVLTELLRIGEKAIVSFPNFGHWRMRASLLVNGRMPVTEELPYSWYDTPNIHFCTINDFVDMTREIGAQVETAVALNAFGQRIGFNMPWGFWNLFGQQAVFLLRR